MNLHVPFSPSDMKDSVSRGLALFGEQLAESTSLCNLLTCFAILFAMWAPLLWWMYHIISTHSTDVLPGFIGAFLFVSAFTGYFVGIRYKEIWDLLGFLLLLFAFCIMWPFKVLMRLAQYLLSASKSLYSRLFVIRKPRYRRKVPKSGSACESRNGHLCSACDLLIDSSRLLTGTSWIFTRPVEYHVHHTVRDLQQSAKECHLCHFLFHSISNISQARFNSGPAILENSIFLASLDTSKKLRVKLWEEQVRGRSLLRLQLCGLDNSDATIMIVEEVHFQGRDPCENNTPYTTNSPSVLRLANGWIESCRNHVLCQNGFIALPDGAFRPTRLIKIEETSPPKLRLIETSEQPNLEPSQRIEYVALSHCWGNTNIKMLLRENRASLKQSIDFSELPLNFQHAILIATGIGVRYLWVDSLCVIQHYPEDWEVEAPRMGLVYANAVCTISATGAKDPFGGCFSPKEAFLNDCILREQGKFSLVVRSWIREESVLERLFDLQVEGAPVTQRGWTFQERLLSKRILHFCNGYVLFECNTMRASEYHESGIPHSRRTNIRLDGKLHSSAVIQRLEVEESHYSKKTTGKVVRGVSTRPITRPAKNHVVYRTEVSMNLNYKSQAEKKEELFRISALMGMRGAFQLVVRASGQRLAEKMEFHQCWYEMVEQYSTRVLSLHTDKLMAVAGIAYFIQKHARRVFLAGLWMGIVPFNLLWIRDEPMPLAVRPMRNLPSWSWASVDGRIAHRLKLPLPRTSAAAFQSTVTSSSSLKSADEIFRTSWEQITPHLEDTEVETPITHNDLIHYAVLKLSCFLFEFNDSRIHFIPDVELDRFGEALFGVPVLSFKNIHVEPINSDLQLHGIVLRAKNDAYERVGYFWTANADVAREILDRKDKLQSIRIL